MSELYCEGCGAAAIYVEEREDIPGNLIPECPNSNDGQHTIGDGLVPYDDLPVGLQH